MGGHSDSTSSSNVTGIKYSGDPYRNALAEGAARRYGQTQSMADLILGGPNYGFARAFGTHRGADPSSASSSSWGGPTDNQGMGTPIGVPGSGSYPTSETGLVKPTKTGGGGTVVAGGGGGDPTGGGSGGTGGDVLTGKYSPALTFLQRLMQLGGGG